MTSAWLPRVGKLRLMPILDPRPVFGCTWYRCLSLYGVVLSCVLLASSFEEWLPAYNCRESLVKDGRSSGSMDVWIISFSLTYPGPGISGDTGSCAICSILGTCSLMQGVSFLWGRCCCTEHWITCITVFLASSASIWFIADCSTTSR